MKKITLHRTHVLSNAIKGYITVEGSSFSCYTLEAQSVEGHNPINPQYAYALPLGTYAVRFQANDIYPIVPFMLARKYKRISFVRQDGMKVRPGCIAIGTKFIGERLLDGADDAFEALHRALTSDWQNWKRGGLLEIVEDPEIVKTEDGTYEEEESDDDDMNFVNL